MTLRVNPENGALLKLDSGSLMKKCCCDAPEESGWFRCEPYWCASAFTAPERFPAIPILEDGINFMMWFSESAREKWDEELGSPNFYYDGRMLWEVKEFLTGDPDPTEDYYSANGWLNVPRQTGENPFSNVVMSELENGYPEAFRSEYGFLSDPVPKEFTVVDASNRRVFHGLNFGRIPAGIPNAPQVFEIQDWQMAYKSPYFNTTSEIYLGLPPNHNQLRDIEITYDPDNPYVVQGVGVAYQGSFPTAGFVPSDPIPGYHTAQTTINWFGGDYTVNGSCFLFSHGGKNDGGYAYPDQSQYGCKSYNMVSGLFHWAFDLKFPGAGGHGQFGNFDIEQTCYGGVDPRPCYALTLNNDAVPDCVQYGPPCSDAGQTPGSPPLPGMDTNLPQCGFIIPTGYASSSGIAFSQPLDVCQTAFGEDCPGGAASDWFGAANSYQDYFLSPQNQSQRITGVSKSFDDTGLAPVNFAFPPAGVPLPGGILNEQCALEIRFL